MRAEIEVDLAHPEVADPHATRASVLEELTGLQRLVDDLLLVARSDAGVALERERVDLAAVVLDEARQSAADGVVVDTADVAPVFVLGDAGQLRRVVRNVFANASRYARTRVAVSLRGDGSGVVLSVEDDGPGVEPADRVRIFERFTRADDARAAATGGVGLGLAIARDIVELHGGTISVVAGASGGARFDIRLPQRI
jgi:signal transduction histidine kinase